MYIDVGIVETLHPCLSKYIHLRLSFKYRTCLALIVIALLCDLNYACDLYSLLLLVSKPCFS